MSGPLIEMPGYEGTMISGTPEAIAALQRLIAAAREAGYLAPYLQPVSGYRSLAVQQRLWQEGLQKHGSVEETRKWVAPPGHSAHETGRAFDLYLGWPPSSNYVEQQRKCSAYQWLVEHAAGLGWYPYEPEPWHWEYGRPHGTGDVAAEIALLRAAGAP